MFGLPQWCISRNIRVLPDRKITAMYSFLLCSAASVLVGVVSALSASPVESVGLVNVPSVAGTIGALSLSQCD